MKFLFFFLSLTFLYSDTAYVTNTANNSVKVIDTTTNTITKSVRVGNQPVPLAGVAGGIFVYCGNQLSNSISVIATPAGGAVATTISLTNPPNALAITPDGAFLYAVSTSADAVLVASAASNTQIDTIAVPNSPTSIAITPSGQYAYVPQLDTDTVAVLRLSDNTVISTINIPSSQEPRSIAITPDGAYVYVPGAGNGVVSVIQTSDNTVVDTINVGDNPRGITISPNGTFAYVASTGTDTVYVIQISTNTVVDTIGVGTSPTAMAVTSDSNFLYVCNQGTDTVSVVNLTTGAVTDTITVGDTPSGIVLPGVSLFPPTSFEGQKMINSFPFQTQYLNVLSWSASPSLDVQSYLLYRDGALIASIPAQNPRIFYDDSIHWQSSYTYTIQSVSSSGAISSAKTTFIP